MCICQVRPAYACPLPTRCFFRAPSLFFSPVSLQARFSASAESIKVFKASKAVPDTAKLAVYGLYKQATIGDCNIPRPGGFFNVRRGGRGENLRLLGAESIDGADEPIIRKPFCSHSLALQFEANAKWDAWNALKGKNTAAAKEVSERSRATSLPRPAPHAFSVARVCSVPCR